jgi:hypothetical protein
MRFLLSILLTFIFAFLLALWLPWWSIAIASFSIAAIFRQSPLKSFLSGFISLFILWGMLAWWIDIKNQSILSRKIALILPLGGSSFLLIIITAFVGALIAGLAALSASFLRPAS